MWHNNERSLEKYNNWNFTESGSWDGDGENSMWYNLNTTALGASVSYKIGSESIPLVNVPLQPEKLILKD